MTMPKMPITWKEFKGNELTAVLFILLLYFVYKEFTGKDDCDDLREALKIERAENAQLTADKEKLTTAIFVKNGVIDAILESVDSTARVKLPPKEVKTNE